MGIKYENFSLVLDNYFKSDKKIKISKSSRIDYYPNGEISFSNNYELNNNKTKFLLAKLEKLNECFKDLKVMISVKKK